jgi:hypothetical protein
VPDDDRQIQDYDFRLTGGERVSGMWNRLREHLEFLRSDKRLQLEKPQDEAKTAFLRGEIRCLSSILEFGNDPPPVPDDGDELGTFRERRRDNRR